MKKSLLDKLEKLSLRHEELNALMSSEDATRDMEKFTGWTREHAELDPLIANYREFFTSRSINRGS